MVGKGKSDLVLLLGRALLDGEHDPIANAANLAALLFANLPQVNWAGVYFLRNGELVLGPFQGKPACTRIAIGAGVCGRAAATRETIVVPDVHVFPGHIASDPASRSAIVVPLVAGERLIGVLDVDSPVPRRFTDDDRRLLEELARAYVAGSKFTAALGG